VIACSPKKWGEKRERKGGARLNTQGGQLACRRDFQEKGGSVRAALVRRGEGGKRELQCTRLKGKGTRQNPRVARGIKENFLSCREGKEKKSFSPQLRMNEGEIRRLYAKRHRRGKRGKRKKGKVPPPSSEKGKRNIRGKKGRSRKVGGKIKPQLFISEGNRITSWERGEKRPTLL